MSRFIYYILNNLKLAYSCPLNVIYICVGSLQTTWSFSDSPGWPRTQQIIVLTAMITVNRCKAESAKGKGMWGRVWRKPGTNFQCPPLVEWPGLLSFPGMSCDSTCEKLPSREAHERTSIQGFIGGWSYRHPPPSIYKNSRLLEGK